MAHKSLLKHPVSEMKMVIFPCACPFQNPPSEGDTTWYSSSRGNHWGSPWIFLQLCLAFLEWQCNRWSQPPVMIACGHGMRSWYGTNQEFLLYGPETPTSGDRLLRTTLQWAAHMHPLQVYTTSREALCEVLGNLLSGRYEEDTFWKHPNFSQGRSADWGQREIMKRVIFLPDRTGRGTVLFCRIYVDLLQYLAIRNILLMEVLECISIPVTTVSTRVQTNDQGASVLIIQPGSSHPVQPCLSRLILIQNNPWH